MKKYKFGVATKKLVALTLCCLTAMTSLTSCSATPHYNMERLQADTGDRFYDTRVLANSLYSSGLISKDSYNTIMDRTSNLSALIAKSMKAAKAEDTSVFGNTNEVIAAWASLSSLDIFYDNNFSNNNNYQDDTFNLLQGIIAFKPVNHSKNDGHTIEDAISVDDGSVRTDKDAFGQPWLEYYSKSGGNDLYGNDNWGGKGSGYKRPDSVDDLNGSEMLYSIVNLMCIHKMLFNVNEGYANTHLDRWFVKGAYVDSERKIISLDTKYNTWGYYNDWDSILQFTLHKLRELTPPYLAIGIGGMHLPSLTGVVIYKFLHIGAGMLTSEGLSPAPFGNSQFIITRELLSRDILFHHQCCRRCTSVFCGLLPCLEVWQYHKSATRLHVVEIRSCIVW